MRFKVPNRIREEFQWKCLHFECESWRFLTLQVCVQKFNLVCKMLLLSCLEVVGGGSAWELSRKFDDRHLKRLCGTKKWKFSAVL